MSSIKMCLWETLPKECGIKCLDHGIHKIPAILDPSPVTFLEKAKLPPQKTTVVRFLQHLGKHGYDSGATTSK